MVTITNADSAEFHTLHSPLHTGNGAPGRTRIDEYEFTKLALWLLEARGQNGVRGRNRTCDLHLRTVALCLTELRGQLASVAGLAPARVGLKIRLRELLCIHGQEWPPRLVSRQRLLLFREALICLSYSGCLRTARIGRPGR